MKYNNFFQIKRLQILESFFGRKRKLKKWEYRYNLIMKTNPKTLERIYKMTFASVYPMYITKVERKWRTKNELHEVIFWLTGYDEKSLKKQVAQQVTFEVFFDEAPLMNPLVSKISGSICGVKIEDIEEPLYKNIRYLDKLVDELAKGRAMEKVLRR